MKNLIKTAFALLALALIVVGPKAAFADYGYDSYGDYGYDSYGDYGGSYGYDSYGDYGSYEYDSYDYGSSYSDYGYDSYGDYGYEEYVGYSDYGYDSYGDYGYEDYGGYDNYETAYDYGGYDNYETAYDYGGYGGYGGGSSYMPYGQSSCIGPCGGSGGSRGGLGLNLNYSTSERNTSIKDSYNTNISNDNDYTSIVTNTRTENTCSNGTNCNTVYNQVAQTNTNTLSGTCPTTGTYNIGQQVTWTASATGGSGSYSYSWSGDVSGSGQTVTQSYGSTGTKNATVTITSGNQSITRSCSVLVQGNNNNYNNLTATCPTTGTYTVGQQVTWTANAYGGNGNYTYNWSGAVNGYGNYLTATYSYPGTQYATVRVTDNSGNSVTQSCQVTILAYYGGTTNPGPGVLTSGVLLSSIPYTGLAENMKMAAFVLGMILWSAFVAWIIMRKKISKKTGSTQSDAIAEFKRQNLARKQVAA